MHTVRLGKVMTLVAVLQTSAYGMEYREVFKDCNDPNYVRVHEARMEFENRYKEWERYISERGINLLSTSTPYINNEAFHRLVELGPVAVPWFMEARAKPDMEIALQAVLRANWPEMAGVGGRIATMVDRERWWKTSPQLAASDMFSARMGSFQERRKQYPEPEMSAQLRAVDEWKRLKDVGLLGVPFVIKRVEAGVADEYDYRLLALWTDPVEYVSSKGGGGTVPKRPDERETIPPDKANSQYWLDWWKANKWQFWWMPNEK